MRIAFIAPYQGRGLLEARPTIGNLALAANLKMELVAELLERRGHEVEILSQGDVDRHQIRFYPGFREPKPFSPSITVDYASSMPIKFIRLAWTSWQMTRLFRNKYRKSPYDAVIIYNLDLPQVLCARYAQLRLGLPVVLEYEDDAVVDVLGRSHAGAKATFHRRLAELVLGSASGCYAASPHLLSRVLSRVRNGIPTLLLRGVVSEDVVRCSEDSVNEREKIVVFSGTFYRSKGLEPLLKAWQMLELPGWQLHLAGDGEKMPILKEMAAGRSNIIFHGVLDRRANARLLSRARIGINPHDLSETPGNVFAFKIIEYLAAGTHVISTPMGPVESELEEGITYMPDNRAETIASTLKSVIEGQSYRRTAALATQETYGPAAVAKSLDSLLSEVLDRHLNEMAARRTLSPPLVSGR